MYILHLLHTQVTQYSCDYENLAPFGCTQYFFGGDTGTVMSYNFQGGVHLASQNQNVCVRFVTKTTHMYSLHCSCVNGEHC